VFHICVFCCHKYRPYFPLTKVFSTKQRKKKGDPFRSPSQRKTDKPNEKAETKIL